MPGDQAMLRRLATGRGASRTGAPPVVHDALRSGGRPLDAVTRGFFERGLGADLGGVRVHDNALAARSAQAVDASAYTVGLHVVFDAGRLAPTRTDGLWLLAHELAHVVQSGPTPDAPGPIGIVPTDAPEERQATQAAARLTAAQAGRSARGHDGLGARPTDAGRGKQAARAQAAIPLPIVDKFDPLPYLLVPGGSAATPYDPPGKVSDPSGKGPSLEDLRGGYQTLFGKKPLNLGLKRNANMPDCSKLETPDSTKAIPRYQTFEPYDLQRQLFDSPLSTDPWPQLTPQQYQAAIDGCPKALPREVPIIPKDSPPKGDFPTSPTAPGTAVV